MRFLKVLMAAMLLIVGVVFGAHAQAAPFGLMANPTFLPNNPLVTVKAGYLQPIPSWQGSGKANVGLYPVIDGLYIGQAAGTISGSASMLPYAANPSVTQVVAVPTSCPQQRVDVTFAFIGGPVWSLAQDAFKITVSNSVQRYSWITAPAKTAGPDQVYNYLLNLPVGKTYMVSLGSAMSYKANTPAPAGIQVKYFQITCI
jgi:hypothetical protein